MIFFPDFSKKIRNREYQSFFIDSIFIENQYVKNCGFS